MVFLLACTAPDPDDPAKIGAPDTASDSSTDSDSDSAEAFSCGEIDPAPTLPAGDWTRAPAIPAGDIVTATPSPSGFPLYLGGNATGMWRADDPSLTWHAIQVDKAHTWGDMAIDPENSRRIWRSNGGVLWRSDDAGGTWTGPLLGVIPTNEHDPRILVLATAATHDAVYAVDLDGICHLSDDAGETWTTLGTVPATMTGHGTHGGHAPSQWRLLAPTPTSPRLLFTDGTTLFASDDGMQSWRAVATDLTGAFALARGDDTVVVGTTRGWSISTDNGDSFATGGSLAATMAAFSPVSNIIALATIDSMEVDGAARALPVAANYLVWAGTTLLVTHDEGILASDDSGETWREVGAGVNDDSISVLAPHPGCTDRVLAGSRCGGGVYRSLDWGGTWNRADDYFHYVMDLQYDAVNPRRVYAVSDDAFLRSDDDGGTWTTVLQAFHFHGFAIDPDDAETLLLGTVGSGDYADTKGRILRSMDGGESWNDISADIPANTASAHTLAYWPGAPDVVLAGYYRGGDVSHVQGVGIGLYRSTDRGESWALSSLPSNDIALLTATTDSVWAATGDGVFTSSDEGQTWSQPDGLHGGFLAIAFHGEVGLAYRQDGDLWRTDDAGATWQNWRGSLPGAGGTALARVAFSGDGAVAYVTPYGEGIWRRGVRE